MTKKVEAWLLIPVLSLKYFLNNATCALHDSHGNYNHRKW